MTQGDIVHGFRLVRKYPSGDFKGTLYAFEHEKSGAQVFWFSTDAKAAAGMIGVRTPIADDTGVAHVLEHMLCYGSRKYSAQDSRKMLIGDTHADLNAFTSHHFTSFQFRSPSREAVCSYLDFWLDHLYHPLELSDPRLFATEGWRYALASDGKLSYNGIVFNEIRTLDDVYVQPPMARALTPGTPDNFDWGGNPDALMKLRPEDVAAFHKTYYHPANTSICLYGDIDIEDTLQFLDTAYFSGMEHRAPAPFDEAYQPPAHTLRREETYEVGSPERDHQELECCFLWLLEKEAWFPTPTELDFLSNLLFRGKSPIRRIMKRDGIQVKFSKHLERLGCQRALKLDIYKGVEEKILHALAALRGYHFQQKDIMRTLKAMEKKQRAAAKKPKDVMDICRTILMDVSTGRDLTEDFHAQTDALLLRMHLADGSLDRFVQQYLAETPPSLFLTLTSSYERRVQRLSAEKEALAQIQAQMKEEELAAIRAQEQSLWELAKWTAAPAAPAVREMPQALAEEENQPLLTEETIGGATLLHAAVSDDALAGRCYFEMSFDASHLPTRDFADLFFWKAALSHLPTVGRSGASFPQRFSNVVQEYKSLSFSFHTLPDGRVQPVFTFHFTCAANEVKKALSLIREMITATSLADDHEVKHIYFQTSWNFQKTWNPDQAERDFVCQAVAADITPYGAARRKLLSSAASQLARNRLVPASKLRHRLTATAHQLFCRERAVVFFAAAEKDVPAIREQSANFLWQLPKAAPSRHTFHVQMQARRTGYYSGQPLQYIAAGICLPYHGSLNVLSLLLLSDHFYPRIRQAGGAYEVEVLPYSDGALAFYSGRDPHLAETLDTFGQAAEFVRTLDVSKDRLAAAIAGVLPPAKSRSGLDACLDALDTWYCGRKKETYRKMLQEAKDTTIDQLRAYAPVITDLAQNGSLCALGNETLLRANAGRFQTLQPGDAA